MKFLFIINDPPYGIERCFNALRLALALLKEKKSEVLVFLMADAVLAAKTGQSTPEVFSISKTCSRALPGKGM